MEHDNSVESFNKKGDTIEFLPELKRCYFFIQIFVIKR